MKNILKVKQFRYSADSLGYLIHDGKKGLVIDPGCPDEIFNFCRNSQIEIKAILNTHTHYDHIMGNKKMEKLTGLSTTEMNTIIKDGKFILGKREIEVIHTPGHMMDCVCFYDGNSLISGDTLFICNIGKCFSGDFASYYDSVQKLFKLPDNTVVFPGHDYTERSINRALDADPENPHIDEFKKQYNPPPVCSTMEFEKKMNPYYRAERSPAVKSFLKSNGGNTATDFECFVSAIKILKS